MERVTDFIIETDIGAVLRVENTGQDISIRHIRVARTSNGISYYSLSNLRNTRSISIFLGAQENLSEVVLPNGMNQRFARYLRRDFNHPPEFDCADFAHFLNGKEYSGVFWTTDWNITPFNEALIQPGDTLFMAKTETELAHMAVYLGDKYYLSKFGYRAGYLIVTTYDQMEKAYPTHSSYICVPKSKSSSIDILATLFGLKKLLSIWKKRVGEPRQE